MGRTIVNHKRSLGNPLDGLKSEASISSLSGDEKERKEGRKESVGHVVLKFSLVRVENKG